MKEEWTWLLKEGLRISWNIDEGQLQWLCGFFHWQIHSNNLHYLLVGLATLHAQQLFNPTNHNSLLVVAITIPTGSIPVPGANPFYCFVEEKHIHINIWIFGCGSAEIIRFYVRWTYFFQIFKQYSIVFIKSLLGEFWNWTLFLWLDFAVSSSYEKSLWLSKQL